MKDQATAAPTVFKSSYDIEQHTQVVALEKVSIDSVNGGRSGKYAQPGTKGAVIGMFNMSPFSQSFIVQWDNDTQSTIGRSVVIKKIGPDTKTA